VQLIVKTLSIRPLVLSIDNFLREEEIAYVISAASPHMVNSGVSLMDKDKGKAATEFRTSQLFFMSSQKYTKIHPVDLRVANLTGCPLANQEHVQVSG
jgi:prolyl 4-hydroxylase